MTDDSGIFPSFPLSAPAVNAQRSNRFQWSLPAPYYEGGAGYAPLRAEPLLRPGKRPNFCGQDPAGRCDMVAIILAASKETKELALKAGFSEATVLIRRDSVLSLPEIKEKIERELFEMRPYQFLVSDFWGAGNG